MPKSEIEKILDGKSQRPTKGIEKVFLAYANSSPGKNPAVASLVYKVGESFLEILDPSRKELDTIVEQIVQLYSMDPRQQRRFRKGRAALHR